MAIRLTDTVRDMRTSQTGRWYKLTLLLLFFTLAVYGLYLLVYVLYARSVFSFPFDYDQGEGFELYDAVRLARGENIYLDNSVFPFYSSNYPPVYRTLLVPLVWLFGPKLWPARAFTFACSLMIGVLIFIAARRQLASSLSPSSPFHPLTLFTILIPLISALSFFAANYVYQIAPLARAHLPMVMFALAGAVCLERGLAETGDGQTSFVFRLPSIWPALAACRRKEHRTRIFRINADLKQTFIKKSAKISVHPRPIWLFSGFSDRLLGIFLLMTAGFTKLQAIDGLAAGFAFLLLRRPKAFGVALPVCIAVTAFIVLGMNALSGGQFWVNVVAANVNEYVIENTWATYGQWFSLQAPLIICSLIYVLWDVILAVRARSWQPITLWSLYFVTGSAMGMLTGKWGAGPAYLIAAIAVSCICTVGLIGRVGGWSEERAARGEGRAARGEKRAAKVEGRGSSGEGRAVSPHAPRPSLYLLLSSLIFLAQASRNIHLPVTGRVFGPLARLVGVADQPSVYPPYPYYDSIGYTQLGHFVDPADIENGWALVHRLQQVNGPVLSEEAMLTLWAGKDVVSNPTQLLNLYKNGTLDTSRMIAMIRARKFGAVVFRAQFYPGDVKEAIVENYAWTHMYRINGFEYWILLPP